MTDDVKKTYFKSLLTGKAFQKTYELFGGVVTVLFEMPKGTLLSAQRTALTSAKKDANITSINDIVLLASLVRIDICDEDDDDTVCAYEKSYEQRESLLLDAENSIKELEASCDYALLSCVRDALMSFGTLIKAISETGLDKNFYEGAGLR